MYCLSSDDNHYILSPPHLSSLLHLLHALMPAVMFVLRLSFRQPLDIPRWNKSCVIFSQAHAVSCTTERAEGSVCQQRLSTRVSEVCGWQSNRNCLLWMPFSCSLNNPLLDSTFYPSPVQALKAHSYKLRFCGGQNWDLEKGTLFCCVHMSLKPLCLSFSDIHTVREVLHL